MSGNGYDDEGTNGYDDPSVATFFERAPFKLPPGVKYKCEHRVILLHDGALSCQGCPAEWKAPKP